MSIQNRPTVGSMWRQGVSRRRFLGTSAAAGAGLASAALIGCSSSGSGTPAAPAGSSAAAGAASGPTLASILGKEWNATNPNEIPKYGGQLNLTAPNADIAHLDPIQVATAFPHKVASLTYSALLRTGRDPKVPGDSIIFPDLANAWEVNDPLKMVFKLRPGVKWHNVAPLNGRALTAEDVKFAINRGATNQTSQFKGSLSAIKSIDTPDASTVVLNLKSFDATLLTSLAANAAWITPKEVLDSGKMKELMIGTGPFIFQRWDQDSRVAYKKNPDYFVKGTPFVDEANMIQIKNDTASFAALRSNQLQSMETPIRDWQTIKDDPKFAWETFLKSASLTVFMNYTDERWKDERVRRALSLALNPDTVIALNAEGQGQWRGIVSGQFGPSWGLPQEELKSNKYYLRENAAEAKQLMSAAGQPNGLPAMPFFYDGAGNSALVDTVQYIGQAVEKAGVAKLNLTPQDRTALRKNQDEHKFTGLLFGANNEPVPEMFILDLRTGGAKNGSGISIPALDATIDAMMSTVDTKERSAKAIAIEREMLPQVPWQISFHDAKAFNVWGANVHNYLTPPLVYAYSGAAFSWVG